MWIDTNGNDNHSCRAEGLKPSKHRKMAKKYAKKEITNKEKEHRQCNSQIHAGQTVPLDY